MHSMFMTVAALAAAALAAPQIAHRSDPGLNPKVVFTNKTCTLPPKHIPYSTVFPSAQQIENILGPALTAAIGTKTIDDIAMVGEDICVDVYQKPNDPDEVICSNLGQLILFLGEQKINTQAAADHYKCLINAFCVAQMAPENRGTCQVLLAGVDCIDARLSGGPGVPECTPAY